MDAAQQKKINKKTTSRLILTKSDFCSAIYKQIHDHTEPQARRESLVYMLHVVYELSVQTKRGWSKEEEGERAAKTVTPAPLTELSHRSDCRPINNYL